MQQPKPTKTAPKRPERVKPSTSRPVATPVRTSDGPHPPETAPNSGNPAAMKRMRSKQSDPDKDRVIEELREAGWGCLRYNIGMACIIAVKSESVSYM